MVEGGWLGQKLRYRYRVLDLGDVMCWARWMVALHLTTSLLVPAVCMHALLPDYCHCYRESAGHVMPADKHNLPSMRGEPDHHDSSINNKRQCQRRLLSPHICITPHAVDRDFQARKQESVTLAWAKARQIQGRDRPPTGVLPSPFPHAIIIILYNWSIIAVIVLMLGNCQHPAGLHVCQCSCMLVLVHSCASQSVVTGGQAGSGSPTHSQVVAITYSCSHRKTMMLEEGQSGSTAFLSVAGQSRERGGTSVVLILLLPTTTS